MMTGGHAMQLSLVLCIGVTAALHATTPSCLRRPWRQREPGHADLATKPKLRSYRISLYMSSQQQQTHDEQEVEGVSQTFLSSCRHWLMSCVATSMGEEDIGADELKDLRAAARQRVSEADARLKLLLQGGVPATIGDDERRALVFARLAAWFNETVRPVEAWVAPAQGEPESMLEAFVSHLCEKYDDVPAPLRASLWYVSSYEAKPVVEASANRVAYRFCKAYRRVGCGSASVRDAIREECVEGLTKKAAAIFCRLLDFNDTIKREGPLRSLRRAQVESLDGTTWIADAVALSKCATFFVEDEIFLGADALPWIVKHAESFAEPHLVSLAADFFVEMRRTDPKYTCARRTPKTVSDAMDAYALTTVTFDDDEAFFPNPRGIRPLFRADTIIPNGTLVEVPYDSVINGGHGPYRLGPGTKRGAEPRTLRIEEILSLKRLIYEGAKLDNCLEDRRESQLKYVMRARQRFSSFWSFTLSGDDDIKHMLLLEVWHLHDRNVVRQAEGPRPRTLPSPEAWYWMVTWCEANNVDWTTWDVYSRLPSIRPCDPL